MCRPVWGQMTKCVSIFAINMMFCGVLAIAQVIVAYATTFIPLALGMGLFGCGFAAYAGFKMVTTTEVFGYKRLSDME